MADVEVINTSNLNTGHDVEVHGMNCTHVARYRRSPHFEPGWLDRVSDPQEIFNDYNEDFYAEGGDEACWAITVFPCSGLVKRKTEVTTWKDI